MITKIIQSSGYNSTIVDFDLDEQLALTSDDVSLPSIFWFRPYKKSNFPMLNFDKDYFFLYSTDHSSGDGGVNLGKGNNLDLSDFQEVGNIFTGYQIETPYLILNNDVDDGEVVHLFCHTNSEDPSNTIGQETKLFTTNSGDLVNSIWTERGSVLGVVGDENHTGYLKCWNDGSVYTGIHLTKGGTPPEYKYSLSDDLRTWTRGGIFDIYSGAQTDYKVKPTYGWFFKKYNKYWWIGTTEPISSTSTTAVDKQLILARSNSNYEITEFVSLFNNGLSTRNYEIYLENNIAHIYFQNPNGETIYYATWDLTMLQNM